MKHNYVISFLNGIELPDKSDNVELGNFIICNYKYLKNLSPEILRKEDHGYTYILYKTTQKVRTKHFESIYCKAINEFMRIMLYYGGKRAFSVPDFSHLFKNSKNFYSTGEEISFTFRSNTSSSYFKKIKLNKSLFKIKGNNIILLDYIDNEPNTQIEKKLNWQFNGLVFPSITEIWSKAILNCVLLLKHCLLIRINIP